MNSDLKDELVDLAHQMSLRPFLFAPTALEVDGMILLTAAVILHRSTGAPLKKCLRRANYLAHETMHDFYPRNVYASLSNESYPEQKPSFEVLQRNSQRFIKLLLDSLKYDDSDDWEDLW